MEEFETIYDDYFNDVYRFALSMSHNIQVAEDVVQDTFVKAMHSVDQLRDDAKIKPWLLTIAKNTYLTKVSRSIKTISIDEIEVASKHDHQAEFLNKDTAWQARKILHRMEEPYKEVFYLRVFAGLNFKEIGELFEKNQSWARQVYHRAKLKIKEKIS